MLKRLLICVFSAVLTLGCMTPCYAIGTETISSDNVCTVINDDSYRKALDLLEICDLATTSNSEFVTNGEFAKAAVGLFSLNKDISYEDAISMLREYEAIPDTMRFLPDTYILAENAYEICVNILGYGGQIQHRGYVEIINDIKLNYNLNGSGKLTQKSLDMLMYNCLIAPLYEIDYISTGVIKQKEPAKSILNKYHNIYFVKGKILAAADASVSGYEPYMRNNSIYIDGLHLYVGNTNADNYCGYKAEVYYQEDLYGEFHVVLYYIAENDDSVQLLIKDVVDVSGFDVDDPIQNRKNPLITFNHSNKKKTKRLDTNVKIIYNNRRVTSISNEDFMGDVGTIRMVDSDEDGYFDIIYIKRYIVGKVDAVSIEKGTIELKDGQNFRFSDIDDVKVLDGEREKSFSGIGVGNVICIYVAKGGNVSDTGEIHIVANTVIGEISRINTNEAIIEIGGKRYPYIPSFNSNLRLGVEYCNYIDDDGVVVYTELSSNNIEYAYFTKYYIDEENPEDINVIFKMILKDGEAQKYTMNSNIKYTGFDGNGLWIENVTVKEKDIKPILAANFSENQLIKVKIIDGAISQIIIPRDRSSETGYAGYTEDEFTLEEIITPDKAETLRQKTKISEKYTAVSMNSMVVLDNVSDEDDIVFNDYTLGTVGILSEESYCLVDAKIYDADKEKVIGVIVVKYDPTMTGYAVKASNYLSNGSRIVVDQITESYNKKTEENTYVIEGYAAGLKIKLEAANCDVTQKFNTLYADRNVCKISDLKCGDVIIPEFDKNGKMNSFNLILDRDQENPLPGKYMCYSGHQETQHTHLFNSVFGKVRHNFENKVLTIENIHNHIEDPDDPKKWIDDTNSYTKFLLEGVVYMCDQDRGELYVSDGSEYINDSLTGAADTVFISRIKQNTEFIIIYR